MKNIINNNVVINNIIKLWGGYYETKIDYI